MSQGRGIGFGINGLGCEGWDTLRHVKQPLTSSSISFLIFGHQNLLLTSNFVCVVP